MNDAYEGEGKRANQRLYDLQSQGGPALEIGEERGLS